MDQLVTYVSALFLVFTILILVRVLFSFFPSRPYSGVASTAYDFVCQSTDWYLNFFRRFLPPLGMIDISPIVALFVLWIIERLVVGLLGGVSS